MMKGGGVMGHLSDSDCGAFDHASHAPQSLSNIIMYMYIILPRAYRPP